MPRKHPNPAARKFRAKIARKLEAQGFKPKWRSVMDPTARHGSITGRFRGFEPEMQRLRWGLGRDVPPVKLSDGKPYDVVNINLGGTYHGNDMSTFEPHLLGGQDKGFFRDVFPAPKIEDPLRQYIRGVRAENHLLQSSQAARDWAALEARVRIIHSDEGYGMVIEEPHTNHAKFFGWYSPTAARKFGSSWYSTPSGGEVEVSFVAVSENSRYDFPDKVSRGEVVDFLRPAQVGSERTTETDGHGMMLGPGFGQMHR